MTPDDVASLYERFGYAVFRRCARIVGGGAAAEDAAQEVFVRVLRYGDGYDGTSALGWLLRIADRACLDRLERERPRAPLHGGGAARADEAAALRPDPEAARLLRELLATLPRILREIAILHYVDEMSLEEIARALGCSTMTVKRRVRKLHERANALVGNDEQEASDARTTP